MISEAIALRARTIAIVGAGPSGIAAAKYLRAEQAFDRIVLYEQRGRSGGIWNYTGDQRDEDLCTIPQTNPRGKNQDPTWKTKQAPTEHATDKLVSEEKEATFLSPVYDKLETNIPRGLMGFQDQDWPQDSQLFPKHETVLKYIDDYAKDVQDMVQYERQVVRVKPADEEYSGAWEVITRDLRSGNKLEEIFDAVIVANGHFITPYIPDIEGIKEWNAQYPGAISHAKYYRNPEEFRDKKVIVVGNSASGTDISTQVAQYSKLPILWSSQSASIFKAGTSPLKQELPPIAKFMLKDQSVEFEDGTVETNIDAVLFATGYFYSLPFLEDVKPQIIADGSHVQHTYKHIFYAPRPTLSFVALPQRVIPFPIAEAQSAVLARVYAGRLDLPSLPIMRAWEQSVIDEMGDGRAFHLLQFPKDGNYINELATWALSAEPKEGLENEGQGKKPPVWGPWEFWCRERFAKVRAAFGALGEARHGVRTMEEVGFSYEDDCQTRRIQTE